MAITTLDNVKTILNIKTTDDDDWIESLISQVESDYIHIRGKPFNVGTKVNIETSGLAQDEEIIIDISDNDYNIGLKQDDTAGMITRRIMNQMKPTPYYEIVTTGTTSTSADIYFTEKFENWTEDYSVLDLSVESTASDITATVTKMQTIYPPGSELTAAQMIHHHLTQHETGKPAGVKSESLGDYSVTYADTQGSYPRAITGQIARYAVML